MVLRKSWFG